MLLMFPPGSLLLPVLQELGAVLQGVYAVVWDGTWGATPWAVFPGYDSPAWMSPATVGSYLS